MHRVVIVLVVLLAGPAVARAEHRCTWWAIPGALAGAAAADAVAFGGFAVAHADINDPAHQARTSWIILPIATAGLALGPIASCHLLDREQHAVPMVSFVIAGAALGMAALGVSWFALEDYRERGIPPGPERFARGEGAGGTGALLIVGGGIGGGLAGYALHEHVFREARFEVLPLATREVRGLALAASF